MTQAELAESLGTTQPVISRWERGRSRPSPRQVVALRKLLGVAEPARGAAPAPRLRPLPEREPERLPLPVEERIWQSPDLMGDIALCASLPKDDVLLAVVDMVGRGPAAALAAEHVRGWLYGWIASRGVAVRLDELVRDLGIELRTSRLDATWFLAVMGRGESPHTVNLHMASHAFPAPLLFAGPDGKTRPTRTETDPGQGPVDVSYLRFEGLEAPWRLVVATDGLLARLGAGDERRGKRSLQRWLGGVNRESPPGTRLRGGGAGDDETLAQLVWASWDEEAEFDAASNVRHTRDWIQVEVSDEGVGGAIVEKGGFSLMRHFADAVDHWEHDPSGKTVFLGFRTKRKDVT